MTSEEIEGLFKPYAGRKNLDAGLALAIGKNIAEAHGGALAAESRMGEGTTFTLTLPMAEERRDA
jgi:signal transduction histidine kinase